MEIISDIDECDDKNICIEGKKCRNSFGSYSCICSDGYEAQGMDCVCKSSLRILLLAND